MTPATSAWLHSTAALAELAPILPGLTAAYLPGLLNPQSPHRLLGVFEGAALQLVYAYSVNPQHRIMRLAFASPVRPDIAQTALVETLPSLVDQVLAQPSVAKISVQLRASSARPLAALLPHNRHFIVEGRLRQEWNNPLQGFEDVWVASAFADPALRPAPGQYWPQGQARPQGLDDFWADWPATAAPVPAPPVPAEQRLPLPIHTPHLELRPLRARDASEDILQWFAHPQILASMNLARMPTTVDGLRALFASYDQRRQMLIGVVQPHDGQVLGFYSLTIHAAQHNGLLALCMAPGAADRVQLIIETIEPLVDAALQTYQLHKITGNVLGGNRRMLFMFARNETFVLEALLRQECLAPDGSRADALVFSAFGDKRLRPPQGHVTPSTTPCG